VIALLLGCWFTDWTVPCCKNKEEEAELRPTQRASVVQRKSMTNGQIQATTTSRKLTWHARQAA
jgi:hypothetical protein